jgi:hypothetical protein
MAVSMDLFAQILFLQQLAEGQVRRLIRDSITDQLNASIANNGGKIDTIRLMDGSLNEDNCSNAWISKIVASGYREQPASLLFLE